MRYDYHNSHFTNHSSSYNRHQKQNKKKFAPKTEHLNFIPYTQRKKINERLKHRDENPEVKKVNEPYPTCAICGRKISYITEALISKEGTSFVHFDCALKEVYSQLQPKQDEVISYIGKGKFALIKVIRDEYVEDERTHRKQRAYEFKIEKEIEWETPEQFVHMCEVVEGTKK